MSTKKARKILDEIRDDLKAGEKKIEEFLTHLAVNKDVSPSTQNQAINALVFLCKHVQLSRYAAE